MEVAGSQGEKRRIDDVRFPEDMELHLNIQGGPQVKRIRYDSPKWDFPDLWGCHQTSYLPHVGNVQNITTYSTCDADNIHRRVTSGFLGTFSSIKTKDVGVEPIGIHPSSISLYDVGSLVGFFCDSERVKSDTFLNTTKTYQSDNNDKDTGVEPLVDNGNEMVDVYNFNEKLVSIPEDRQSSIPADCSIRNVTFEQYISNKSDNNNRNVGACLLVEKGDELIDRYHINEQLVSNPENSLCSTYSYADLSIRNETFEQSTLNLSDISNKDAGAYSLVGNGDKLIDRHHVNEKPFTNPEDSLCSTSTDLSNRNKTFKQSALYLDSLDSAPESYDLTRQSDRYHVNEKSVSTSEDSLCSISVDLSIRNKKFKQSTLNPEFSCLDSAPRKLDLARPSDANFGENSRSSKSAESYNGDSSTPTLPRPVLAPKLSVSTDGYHPQLRSPADTPSKKLPNTVNYKNECTICGKRFPTNCKLNDHMNAHINYRPFKCECGKDFVKKFCLLRHQKVHRKFFTCSYCKEKFLLPKMLGKHKSDCPLGNNQHLQLHPHGQWLLEQHKHQQDGERHNHHSSKQRLQEPKETLGMNNVIISPSDLGNNVSLLGTQSNPEQED